MRFLVYGVLSQRFAILASLSMGIVGLYFFRSLSECADAPHIAYVFCNNVSFPRFSNLGSLLPCPFTAKVFRRLVCVSLSRSSGRYAAPCREALPSAYRYGQLALISLLQPPMINIRYTFYLKSILFIPSASILV